jgi:hypothetical protein
MKAMVDKVTDNIISNKASIAQNIVKELKDKGSLSSEKKIFNLDEIVCGMIADDPYTLHIYKTRVAVD